MNNSCSPGAQPGMAASFDGAGANDAGRDGCDPRPPKSPVGHDSPVAAKIGLFRSLFRGREDIHARRFESAKSGRSGYAPACGNEWVRGVCEKPRIKCADCPNRRFLPITDEVVRWHLSGRDPQGRDFVMGVYPMLQDETCFFLAVDLDGQDWSQDAGALIETCRQPEVPAALERSRSGNGGHVWLFFAEPVPASLARKLGAHLLTETMERRPEIGLRSYDRLFPNQDTLPKGGFGNLIALPLRGARHCPGGGGRGLTECPFSTADGVRAAEVAWASPECVRELGNVNRFPRFFVRAAGGEQPANIRAVIFQQPRLSFGPLFAR